MFLLAEGLQSGGGGSRMITDPRIFGLCRGGRLLLRMVFLLAEDAENRWSSLA